MRYNRLFDWDRDGKLEPDELRRMDEYLSDDDNEPDGEEERVYIVKQKSAPPFRYF